jgi:CBS domain-containing protein
MTTEVITASPDFSILDIIRELEQYQISAMPVVDQGKVLGMVNSDLITQRYFLEYLQTR